MRKSAILVAAVVLILALIVGCGLFGLHYYHRTFLTIDGVRYRQDVTALDLSGAKVTQPDQLAKLKQLKTLDLRGTGLSNQDYDLLHAALPDCDILWNPWFQGRCCSADLRGITVTSLTSEDVAALDYFPQLRSVDAMDCEDYEQILALVLRRPECRVLYSVNVGGREFADYTTGVTALDLSAQDVQCLMTYLPRLESVTLQGSLPGMEALTRLREQFPEVLLSWEIELGEKKLTSQMQEADLSGVSLTVDAVESALAYLPELKKLTMCGCGIANEDMARLREEHNTIAIIWSMEIGGTTVRTDDAEIDLSGRQLTVAEIEDLMPYFTNLRKVEMLRCGISNEEMDALNRRYEDTRFIWSVYINGAWVRTDITTFMAWKLDIQATDAGIYNLRYCPDVICVDLGHMKVTNCEFAAFMPHLKYLLLADTQVRDLTPLKGLKELIYLEIFLTQVYDLTPLLECPALEDINLCWTFGDPTPLTQMTWLKNVWWGGTDTLTPGEEKLLRQSLPDAHLELDTYSSTGMGWRKLQNYYDMRDILGMWYMS